MKLSFSTKGWHGSSFEEFCGIAKDLRFSGIELHNVYNVLFTGKDSAFHDYATAATLRRLYEMKLAIPCIDSIGDPADPAAHEESRKEILECIRIARNLHIPNVRIHAKDHGVNSFETVKAFLSELMPVAEETGISLLVETSGLFSNTATLRDLLEFFACDHLAALWDMYSTYFMGN